VKKRIPEPLLVNRDTKTTTQLKRLAKRHTEFNEQYLQELLVDHPELLPVQDLRPDIGDLVCIGREVSAGDSGIIDNLYLSTGGYPVIVETKLWRNPQARREVLSQVLDYTKEIATKDYDWLDKQWGIFSKGRLSEHNNLLDMISEVAAEELDEHEFIDRVNRALDRGDIISLIVGDGIESRLQALVSHLCKDSAHLRYSLALVELACYQIKGEKELLIVPRIVREVEPIQRAYVKIDVANSLEKQIAVQPIVDDEPSGQVKKRRTTLTEEDFLTSLDNHIGVDLRRQLEAFCNDLIDSYRLEPYFGSAALMLKIPDSLGENPGINIFAIERAGRAINTRFFKGGMINQGIPPETAESIANNFWAELNKIDSRFRKDGMDHMYIERFIPIQSLIDKLGSIKEVIGKTVQIVRTELDQLLD
jgi:hypothetical protein